MKKAILGLFLMGMTVGSGLGAPVPDEKKVQFSMGGMVMTLSERYSDGSFFLAGAAVRVDLNLGRSIILAPEVSAGIGGYSAGGTINVRAGKLFAGAGGLAVGGFEEEWGINAFLKAHVGIKSSRGLFAASLITNRWITGFGLTAAYIF